MERVHAARGRIAAQQKRFIDRHIRSVHAAMCEVVHARARELSPIETPIRFALTLPDLAPNAYECAVSRRVVVGRVVEALRAEGCRVRDIQECIEDARAPLRVTLPSIVG